MKGPVLKTGRSCERRVGSNPTSSAILLFIYRGVEQLVARWAHNPKVVGSNPSSATNGFVVQWLTRLPVTQKIAGSIPVETAICGSVAQSVEQRTENPCVDGSIPFGATIFNYYIYKCFICILALVAQLDRVFGYEPKGQGFESLRAHQFGKWLNLVEHLVWDQGVAGSNPVFSTSLNKKLVIVFFIFFNE